MSTRTRLAVVAGLFCVATLVGGATTSFLSSCGPFSDVSSLVCNAVVKIYFLGITAGTTPTTFSEGDAVTRGQMALFLGRTYDQIKRTENPVRLAMGLVNMPYNGNFLEVMSNPAVTNQPIGFATDGFLDYVAGQGNNKIGIYYASNGTYIASYTTTDVNNRMVCDGTYLYITSKYGTTVKRIALSTGTVQEPYFTGLPSGTGDLALAGGQIAVATGSGVSINDPHVGTMTNVNLGGSAYGVVYDGAFIWASGGSAGNKLYKIDLAGAIQPGYPVTLDGPVNYYMGNDGQNLWIPIADGGTTPAVEIVGMHLQSGLKVDKLFTPFGMPATAVEGIAYNGRYMVVAWQADFGCGSPTMGAAFYDAGSHAFLSGAHTCNDTDAFTVAFNGYGFRWLGYGTPGTVRGF